ncbi:hypothetical protein [Serratia marcescens]|uniref:hypothetical protein n=1 Tax=Serratia marcescens TaxID=615 RepID=UPI0012B50C9F|nr:hypothetical protein [Serratia marcescens]
MRIKINWNGMIFDGELQRSVQNDERGTKILTKITIPKTEDSINAFIMWPVKQNVSFECHPDGTGEYSLASETATSYIFE